MNTDTTDSTSATGSGGVDTSTATSVTNATGSGTLTTTTGVGGTGSGGAGGASTGGSGGTTTLPDLPWQCDGTACVPGAACDESTGFCECSEGFEGDGWWCLATAPCDDSPCQNGGTCHPTVGDRVLCSCPAGFGGVHCEAVCTGEVAVPDAALAEALRGAASLAPGAPITGEALATVTSLSLSGTPVSDLSGIECMTALSWLSISEAGLTDLAPLAALPRLNTLRLGCNSFTDLSPLASLINLVELDIGKGSACEVPGQVTDISPLSSLPGLATLVLSGHDLDSLEPLAPLTHLRWLILASNERLASLTGLEPASHLRYFVATDTQVSDLSVFTNHPSVETLWLSGSPVSDLTPLLGASALEELHVVATEVDCTEQAENLQALADSGVEVESSCE